MDLPLVSIVIPFYNHRNLIQKAVKNLFAQTYPHWEVILVDNNSSDGSREVAQELAEKYPGKVRYSFEAVQGIPFARNRGLAEACGKYISFLDVDDEFVPTKLADQVPILEENPEVAMVYGLTRRVYVHDGRTVIQDVGIAKEGVNEPPYLAIDWLTCFYHLPQVGATLVRTSVARQIGGFAENLLMGNDDVAFHLKIAFHYKIWFLPKEAVIYYRHPHSEGARLNREQGVTARYLDAYSSWVVPYAFEYKQQTGDNRPYYWAEWALAGNIAEYAHQKASNLKERRYLIYQMLRQQQQRGYLTESHFKVMLAFHSWLPRRLAKFATRALRRSLFLVSPQKFPREIPKP